MLAALFADTQTTTKAAAQWRDINGKNKPEKTTKMYFSVILRPQKVEE